jgi:exodeoxyribonuclease VII large subunit
MNQTENPRNPLPDAEFGAFPVRSQAQILSVTDLNRRAKNLLEANFELIWVAGEISNATRAPSGHWYFSLKDSTAQVRCVLFRQRAALLGFAPENGQKVEVRAIPSLYEARGEFQLGVETMRRAGLGALFEAFERLKAALRAEGLFDEDRKRPLPVFPKRIGIVTSLAAAALRDVLATLRRRAPMLGIVIYPTVVQGAGAAAEIAAAIDAARVRNEVDTLIVCRGGGSIEDLWSFNEEPVARAIARVLRESPIVVVSGVGHETDFTIADFVADRRAATPTAAAELASPDREELLATLSGQSARMQRGMRQTFEAAQQGIDLARRRLLSPDERMQRERLKIAGLRARLSNALAGAALARRHAIADARHRLERSAYPVAAAQARAGATGAALRHALSMRLGAMGTRVDAHRHALAHLNPSNVLERGYALVEHEGQVLNDARQVAAGASIEVRLAHGQLQASVTKVSG